MPNKKESSAFFTSFSIIPIMNFGLKSRDKAHTRKNKTVQRRSNFGIAIIENIDKKIKLQRRLPWVCEFLKLINISKCVSSQSSFERFSSSERIKFNMSMRYLYSFRYHANLFYSKSFFEQFGHFFGSKKKFCINIIFHEKYVWIIVLFW